MDRIPVHAEILRHLGGHRFKAVTAVRNFQHGERSLSFDIMSSRTKSKIDHVEITQREDGDYNMVFFRTWNQKRTRVSQLAGVTDEQLPWFFASQTGLLANVI